MDIPRARGPRNPRERFTVDEVARETNRNPEVIYRWIASGRVPPHTVLVDTSTHPARYLLNPEAIGIIAMQPRKIRRTPA